VAGDIVPSSSEDWSCQIALGRDLQQGDGSFPDNGQYGILAVFVNPAETSKFRDYVKNVLPSDPDGMTNYPENGVTVKDSILVARNSSRVDPPSDYKIGFC
jgi:hypothetical protein